MDIKDFLPFLMKNNASNNTDSNNNQMASLLSALTGDSSNNSNMMEALLSQTMGKDSKSSEMLTLLKLMQQNQKKGQKALGFKPIYPFVPKDILGILVKYFNN